MPTFKHGNQLGVKNGLPGFLEDVDPKRLPDGHCYDWIQALQSCDIPSILVFNREANNGAGKWECTNKAIINFFSIISNGDPKWIKAYFNKGGKFRSHVLSDNDGRIRMWLLANAIARAEGGDLKFSQHALEIIESCDEVNVGKVQRNREYMRKYGREKQAGKRKSDPPRGLRNLADEG